MQALSEMQKAVEQVSGADDTLVKVPLSLTARPASQASDKDSQLDALENSLKLVESGMAEQSRTLKHLSKTLDGRGGTPNENAENRNTRVVLGCLKARQNSPKVAGRVQSVQRVGIGTHSEEVRSTR